MPATRPLEAPSRWPSVDVIVPVRDEASLIEDKLRNVAELRYPLDRLRVWIVDGGSSDATAELAEDLLGGDERFTLLRLGTGNKTAQINAALERSESEWVLVTDGDARLGPETLNALVAAGELDPGLAAIGTPVEPAVAHPLDRVHWAMLNWLRSAESRRGSASIVAAPCYLFRRRLLRALPDDVVADDVHVAFAAAASGRRVGYVGAQVEELRAPLGICDLFRHKVRKADAYLREVFRFLPRVGRMRSPAREVFLWRAAHMTLVPVLAGGLAIGLAIIGLTVTWPPGTALGRAAIGSLVLVGATLLARCAPRLVHWLTLAALLTVVLLVALMLYPLSRQTARFPKVVAPVARARLPS
jgi:cellulose synthase/poly-beta-1,6-N-acetylglucosamine synthase-like glycosyltransferase